MTLNPTPTLVPTLPNPNPNRDPAKVAFLAQLERAVLAQRATGPPIRSGPGSWFSEPWPNRNLLLQ